MSYLIRAIGVYPLYSVVALNSGELAVVGAITPGKVHLPLLYICRDQSGKTCVPPVPLDLILEPEGGRTIRDVRNAVREGLDVEAVLETGVCMSQSLSPTPDPAPKGSLSWLPTREDTSLIFESSGEAMFVTDRDGRILSLNRVAQQLVGRHQDVIGTMFHELLGCLFSRKGDHRGCPLVHTVRTGEVTMVSPHLWIRADGTGLRSRRRSGPGVRAWSVLGPWLSVAT